MNPPAALDPAALDRLRKLGGDKFAADMIALFLDYVGQKIAEARAAQAAGDLAAVRKAAHPIRSSAGNVGAVHVQEVATRLEIEARDGLAAAIATSLPELEQAYAAAGAELTAVRQGLLPAGGAA